MIERHGLLHTERQVWRMRSWISIKTNAKRFHAVTKVFVQDIQADTKLKLNHHYMQLSMVLRTPPAHTALCPLTAQLSQGREGGPAPPQSAGSTLLTALSPRVLLGAWGSQGSSPFIRHATRSPGDRIKTPFSKE